MATDWSMTHSPTPRYLSTHFVTSLFSPAILSVLKLHQSQLGSPLEAAGPVGKVRGIAKVSTYVKPVDRFIPARNAETGRDSSA
jgi:hypothetical protein